MTVSAGKILCLETNTKKLEYKWVGMFSFYSVLELEKMIMGKQSCKDFIGTITLCDDFFIRVLKKWVPWNAIIITTGLCNAVLDKVVKAILFDSQSQEGVSCDHLPSLVQVRVSTPSSQWSRSQVYCATLPKVVEPLRSLKEPWSICAGVPQSTYLQEGGVLDQLPPRLHTTFCNLLNSVNTCKIDVLWVVIVEDNHNIILVSNKRAFHNNYSNISLFIARGFVLSKILLSSSYSFTSCNIMQYWE